MGRKGPRQIVFTCAAIVSGKLVLEPIEKNVSDEAIRVFETKHGVKPETVLGPFFRKRMGVLNNQAEIKFAGNNRKASYNDWYVTAMSLETPAECAWVFFDKRVDDKKVPKPQSTVIKNEDLRFLTDEEIKLAYNN